MHAVADMHVVGITTGIAIRHDDGTISTHALANASGDADTLTLATPVADTSAIPGFADTGFTYGALVVAGRLGSEYRRLLVAGIAPDKTGKATLTLVDEAPDLVRSLVSGGYLLLAGDGQTGGSDGLLLAGDEQDSGNDLLLLAA
jgi:hypothetical protein